MLQTDCRLCPSATALVCAHFGWMPISTSSLRFLQTWADCKNTEGTVSPFLQVAGGEVVNSQTGVQSEDDDDSGDDDDF